MASIPIVYVQFFLAFTALGLLVWGVVTLVRRVVTVLDVDRCSACGYDLKGVNSGKCPECSWGGGKRSGKLLRQSMSGPLVAIVAAGIGFTLATTLPYSASLVPTSLLVRLVSIEPRHELFGGDGPLQREVWRRGDRSMDASENLILVRRQLLATYRQGELFSHRRCRWSEMRLPVTVCLGNIVSAHPLEVQVRSDAGEVLFVDYVEPMDEFHLMVSRRTIGHEERMAWLPTGAKALDVWVISDPKGSRDSTHVLTHPIRSCPSAPDLIALSHDESAAISSMLQRDLSIAVVGEDDCTLIRVLGPVTLPDSPNVAIGAQLVAVVGDQTVSLGGFNIEQMRRFGDSRYLFMRINSKLSMKVIKSALEFRVVSDEEWALVSTSATHQWNGEFTVQITAP